MAGLRGYSKLAALLALVLATTAVATLDASQQMEKDVCESALRICTELGSERSVCAECEQCLALCEMEQKSRCLDQLENSDCEI